MKVLINGKVYDAENTPMILYLNDQDKENLKNFPETASFYTCFPNELGFNEAFKIVSQKTQTTAQTITRELLMQIFNK